MLFLDKHQIEERIGAINVAEVWNKVGRILPTDRVVERADACELIMLALERFIMQFPGELCIDIVEDWINAPIGHEYAFRGIVDAAGWHKTSDKISRIVIDFKTTQGQLDWRWKNRVKMSMQPRLYLSALDADEAYFVGLSLRSSGIDPDIEIVTFAKSESVNEEVNRYLDQTIRLYSAVANEPVFPQNRPSACAGGSAMCPFLNDCMHNKMPRQVPEHITHWSATSLQMFHECPEKWRRIKCGEQPEPNQRMIFGSAVHLGIAECLRQIWNLPEPETETPILTSIAEE